eukprot:1146599-Pelagomonas_calceolata.AAC.5
MMTGKHEQGCFQTCSLQGSVAGIAATISHSQGTATAADAAAPSCAHYVANLKNWVIPSPTYVAQPSITARAAAAAGEMKMAMKTEHFT